MLLFLLEGVQTQKYRPGFSPLIQVESVANDTCQPPLCALVERFAVAKTQVGVKQKKKKKKQKVLAQV